MSAAHSAFAVAIVGAGPAGLMAAEILSQSGIQVDVYDAMPSAGRKFLRAGVGGMNITHAEDPAQFPQRYAERQMQFEKLLRDFPAAALREWVHGLGIDTFVGSSGRVFPRAMKAAPLLRAWLHRLRERGVAIHTRHRWLGWCDATSTPQQMLRFATPDGEIARRANALVLALGGGSWSKLGSDGSWVSLLQQRGVDIAPLKPANCGFDIDWSAHFRQRHAGQPLKSIAASAVDRSGTPLVNAHGAARLKGECVVTQHGIEGGVIYALAAPLREHLIATGSAHLHIDLAPDRGLQNVVAALAKARASNSLANHLRKQLHIDGVKAGLLFEKIHAGDTRQQYADPVALATLVKALPLTLRNFRPLDEAISSAGGVRFEALDERSMLRALPGVFCAGEMLDWEAPTGGYLLTGCFASGRAAGMGVLAWRKSNVMEVGLP